MISASQLDTVLLLGAVLAIALALAASIRRRPTVALVICVVVLAFVPYWAGVNIVYYFPPFSAVAALLLVSIPFPQWTKIGVVDIVIGTFVLVVSLAYLLGFVGLSAWWVVICEWFPAYLLGRLLAELHRMSTIYTVVGVAIAIAAFLGIIEFVFSWNPFIGLARPGGLYETWGTLQERSGIFRVEGAFGHSIALGAVLSMGLPMVLGSRLRRGWMIAGALAIIVCSGLTLSRTGIVQTMGALVLCAFALKGLMTARARTWIVVAACVIGAIAVPVIQGVFDEAGSEASESAEYRGTLTSLIPLLRLVGTSDAMYRTADGVVTWGGFKSIDSAIILSGLTYGILPTCLLLFGYVVAVVVMVRGRATPALIAIVVQLPGLLGVALITQYATALWFIAGVAVVANADLERERQSTTTADHPSPHRDAGVVPRRSLEEV